MPRCNSAYAPRPLSLALEPVGHTRESPRIAMNEDTAQPDKNLSLLKWIREQITFIKDNKAGTDEMMENIDLDLEMIQSTMDETSLTITSCMGPDFELEERVKEWCGKNGFELLGCDGDGDDDGFEPKYRRGW